MFCPACRAEYRPGFNRCSDCGIDLLDVLPPADARHSESRHTERPDLAPPAYFLAWFLPMAIFVVLFGAVTVRPVLFQNVYVLAPLLLLILVHNFGAFWMLYQAVRYEKRVGKYVLLSFVPFMFVWYSLVRIPLRRAFQGNSSFIR